MRLPPELREVHRWLRPSDEGDCCRPLSWTRGAMRLTRWSRSASMPFCSAGDSGLLAPGSGSRLSTPAASDASGRMMSCSSCATGREFLERSAAVACCRPDSPKVGSMGKVLTSRRVGCSEGWRVLEVGG